jgi:hypothetical protein
MTYADDVNLLADNIHTTNKNTERLIDASKDVGLKVKKLSICQCYITKMQTKIEDKNRKHII